MSVSPTTAQNQYNPVSCGDLKCLAVSSDVFLGLLSWFLVLNMKINDHRLQYTR